MSNDNYFLGKKKEGSTIRVTTARIFIIFILYQKQFLNMGKGQNYENHNVKNQKELQKLRRRSERRNGLFS
jgi:hypothetical protein